MRVNAGTTKPVCWGNWSLTRVGAQHRLVIEFTDWVLMKPQTVIDPNQSRFSYWYRYAVGASVHLMLLIVQPQISTALNWHVIGDDSRPSSASVLSAVSQIALIQSTVTHLRHCAPSCIFEKLAGSMEPTRGLNDMIQNYSGHWIEFAKGVMMSLWNILLLRFSWEIIGVFSEKQQSKQCKLNE